MPPAPAEMPANLERHYKDNGYPDVRITRELLFTPDLRLADVLFHIQEGEKR